MCSSFHKKPIADQGRGGGYGAGAGFQLVMAKIVCLRLRGSSARGSECCSLPCPAVWPRWSSSALVLAYENPAAQETSPNTTGLRLPVQIPSPRPPFIQASMLMQCFFCIMLLGVHVAEPSSLFAFGRLRVRVRDGPKEERFQEGENQHRNSGPHDGAAGRIRDGQCFLPRHGHP
uniref:Uncharacterized protein n=1 Tax=Triticum urartu TaxID=4572 RepID=A0A8R7Q932_TRIUA